MGKKIKKVLSYLFFTLAIIMTLSGTLGYFIMSSDPNDGSSIREAQKELLETDNARQEKIDGARYDEDVDFARGSDIAEAKKHYHSSIEEYGIGSIYMPDSGISVPILAGTSEWNLFNGVGTGRADQELGEGLFIGLSHNLVNDRLLKNIDQMKSGDYVYASDFTNVYTYQVIDQKVVHETNDYYFQEPKEDESAKMLLYRCEGKSGTDMRRVLYSEFIEVKSLTDVEDSILKGLEIEIDETDKNEDIEEVVEENVEDDKKGFIEKYVSKLVNFIGQFKSLNNYFLSVYALADSNPIIFGLVAIAMFILYGIL